MLFKLLFIYFLIILFSLQDLKAQALKQEVEDSIQRDEMPSKALETLEEFWPVQYDILYYFQTDGESETYEAKLEWRGKSLSIEFSSEGRILDIEQLIETEEISPDAIEGIENYLEQEFRRVHITRLQRQFIAEEEDDDSDDEDFLEDVLEGDDDDYMIRYEMEVEGSSGREIGAYELLFDHSGELIQHREIVRRSIDNIW